MKIMWFKLLLLAAIANLFLLACNSQPAPTLAAAGQSTLVYVYTDP
jgi:hypothetical protein